MESEAGDATMKTNIEGENVRMSAQDEGVESTDIS
jgi:hypothetical protein